MVQTLQTLAQVLVQAQICIFQWIFTKQNFSTSIVNFYSEITDLNDHFFTYTLLEKPTLGL